MPRDGTNKPPPRPDGPLIARGGTRDSGALRDPPRRRLNEDLRYKWTKQANDNSGLESQTIGVLGADRKCSLACAHSLSILHVSLVSWHSRGTDAVRHPDAIFRAYSCASSCQCRPLVDPPVFWCCSVELGPSP